MYGREARDHLRVTGSPLVARYMCRVSAVVQCIYNLYAWRTHSTALLLKASIPKGSTLAIYKSAFQLYNCHLQITMVGQNSLRCIHVARCTMVVAVLALFQCGLILVMTCQYSCVPSMQWLNNRDVP